MTTEDYIERVKKIYGDEYDYSKTIFVDWGTKIIVTCREHGDFEVSPRHHLYRHHGCKECRGEHISKSKQFSQDRIIEMSKKVHGDLYDYSLSIYKGIDKDMDIICKKHGIFQQTPYNHIHKKCGCSKCKYENLSNKFRLSLDVLLSKFYEKHGKKYEYPNIKEEYLNNRSEITIICPIHGAFKQTVMKHLQGQGCSLCHESILEKEICVLLDKNSIEYIRQMKFDWLKLNKPMSLDFYLPKYNIAIECQGEQHFKPIEHFGGKDEYKLILERDTIKNHQCLNNGLKLLYYTKYKNVDGDNIYRNKNNLLKSILNYGND